MSPRVSILLPFRDAERTIGAALRSIARQTEHDFECVAVDDGSRDGGTRQVRDMAKADPRFRLIAAPRDGLVAALELGLGSCTGRYLARMDADDVMHRERLAAQCDALDRDGSLAAVGSHVRLFPRRDLGVGMRAYEAWLNAIDSPESLRREAFVECPVAHPSLLGRREWLVAHGYRERPWPEDYDLVLRALERGDRIGVVPRRLLAWRLGPGQLSRTDERYSIPAFTACKAEFLCRSFLRHTDRYVLWGFGRTGRTLRTALANRGRSPEAIVELHPGRLGQRIHGARVVAPSWLRESPGLPIVASVAGASPRAELRAALEEMGYADGRDFVCAA